MPQASAAPSPPAHTAVPAADPRSEPDDPLAPLPLGTPGLTRDYFRVEDRAGRRFWVFREGLYERETGRPRWFLQGLFA